MQPQKPQRESMQACLCSFLVGPSPPFGIGRLFTDYVRTFILSHPVRNPNNVHYNKYNNRKKRKSFMKLDVFQCACQYITADNNCYSWDTQCTCNGQETTILWVILIRVIIKIA